MHCLVQSIELPGSFPLLFSHVLVWKISYCAYINATNKSVLQHTKCCICYVKYIKRLKYTPWNKQIVRFRVYCILRSFQPSSVCLRCRPADLFIYILYLFIFCIYVLEGFSNFQHFALNMCALKALYV